MKIVSSLRATDSGHSQPIGHFGRLVYRSIHSNTNKGVALNSANFKFSQSNSFIHTVHEFKFITFCLVRQQREYNSEKLTDTQTLLETKCF